MTAVLEGGPWTMDHRPFILCKWTSQVCMEQERLSSIPIWIRLPNLPLHLWEEIVLVGLEAFLEFLFMQTPQHYDAAKHPMHESVLRFKHLLPSQTQS
ncbi:hypothetical protein QJS10_CPB13g00756 [Acorus calamus]|uniref:DUF4283 domain-containing protein n=1 Tax=Acorus calamus TaxID=4465 RepID=A0AAV9DG05_ACOCL|nr:hypothetical protein QJS10_CPB13g00756 [Acorus calamus]